MAVTARKSTSKNPKSTSHRPDPIRSHYPEAPDRGEQDREAPEARPDGRLPEAPDAGEGRMGSLEQEFTHGRSQS